MILVFLTECNVGYMFVDSNVYDVQSFYNVVFFRSPFYGSIDMIMFLLSLSVIICCFTLIVLCVSETFEPLA